MFNEFVSVGWYNSLSSTVVFKSAVFYINYS